MLRSRKIREKKQQKVLDKYDNIRKLYSDDLHIENTVDGNISQYCTNKKLIELRYFDNNHQILTIRNSLRSAFPGKYKNIQQRVLDKCDNIRKLYSDDLFIENTELLMVTYLNIVQVIN